MGRTREAFFAAVAACLTFLVVPALASAAPVLTNPTGTVLATGVTAVETNVGDVKFTTSLGTIICSTAVLKGPVATNSTASGSKNEVTSASFTGTGSGGDCTSWMGSVAVTSNPPTNGLPWCWESTAPTDELRLRGGNCSSLSRPIQLTMDFTSPVLQCVYQRSAAQVGTVQTHVGGEVAGSKTMSQQEWTLLEGGGFCASFFKLDAVFTLETAGGSLIYTSS